MTIKTGKIVIGTSGFSYPDWKGVFYPPGMSKDDWLKYTFPVRI